VSNNHLLISKPYSLSYRIYGNGPEMLLAFHGFGRDGSDFKVFEKLIGDRYTIYAFDLFFHGNADNKILPPIDASSLAHMMEKMMWNNKRVKCSLMGYSLGGRIALCLMQKLPHRINEVFLLAPDGLKMELHEEFITRTLPGRVLYKGLIRKPAVFFQMLNALSRTGFIHHKLKAFIEMNMSDAEKRQRVFNTWMIFHKLKPDLSVIAHYISSKKIRVELFFGKYDQIIKPSLARKLTKRLKQKIQLHLLECGHQLLRRPEEISAVILRSDLPEKDHAQH
jgi:pimeloyl-ACP methyl ester carboxylesterase